MRHALIVSILVFGLSAMAVGRQASPALFELYRIDPSCSCIDTRKQTTTVLATEKQTSTSVYQMFWSRFNPKRELFRVKVGQLVGSTVVKLWHYGIADESDFNGDGVPDYSWYGGDDTASVMYLFLSSGSKYKTVDVLKTVEAAWARRFHQAALGLGDADGEYQLANTRLERSSSGLTLLATVTRTQLYGKKTRYQFRIRQTNFRP